MSSMTRLAFIGVRSDGSQSLSIPVQRRILTDDEEGYRQLFLPADIQDARNDETRAVSARVTISQR
jgi:hypothetical protein